jgi:hypothetical protein
MQRLNFSDIQSQLLDEAKASPNLLSDLAGLESYIAESYNNRSFIELLQNADDAGATKFYVNNDLSGLIVANNGREFTTQDVISLCRSASSNKAKGQSIGYRGIGFKSIVGFAQNVHLLSEEYNISFSKEETQKLIPQATKVPLVRIPHILDSQIIAKYSSIIQDLKKEGFTTIFIFTHITNYAVDAEIESFNPNTLLFLRNVLSIQFFSGDKIVLSISKQVKSIENGSMVAMNLSKGDNTLWRLYQSDYCSIAFKYVDKKIVKLDSKEALVSAFLPTEDVTGLGILINGNFATDPSRRHVIINDETINIINDAAKLIVTLLSKALEGYFLINGQILNALVPNSDPKIYQFKKTSFEKILFEKIQENAQFGLPNIVLSPPWYNVKDFEIISKGSNYTIIDRNYYEIIGLISFLKYLGAKDMHLNDMCRADLSNTSNIGCAQIAKQVIQSSIPSYKLPKKEYGTIPIFVCGNEKKSILQINNEETDSLDPINLSLLTENLVSNEEVKRFFKQNVSEEKYNTLFPTFTKENIDENDSKASCFPEATNSMSTKDINYAINEWLRSSKKKSHLPSADIKWRSAEIQAKEVLNSIGFSLHDVSKQNIGYDLEGLDPNGRNIMIEIKSINSSNAKIELTNNEIALAQEKKDKYYVAIVKLSGEGLELMLISDPVKNLHLERQAVQWKWVCDDYVFDPIKFSV